MATAYGMGHGPWWLVLDFIWWRLCKFASGKWNFSLSGNSCTHCAFLIFGMSIFCCDEGWASTRFDAWIRDKFFPKTTFYSMG